MVITNIRSVLTMGVVGGIVAAGAIVLADIAIGHGWRILPLFAVWEVGYVTAVWINRNTTQKE